MAGETIYFLVAAAQAQVAFHHPQDAHLATGKSHRARIIKLAHGDPEQIIADERTDLAIVIWNEFSRQQAGLEVVKINAGQ